MSNNSVPVQEPAAKPMFAFLTPENVNQDSMFSAFGLDSVPAQEPVLEPVAVAEGEAEASPSSEPIRYEILTPGGDVVKTGVVMTYGGGRPTGIPEIIIPKKKERETVMMGGEEWDIISTYSRKQAIADGVLIDVTETAKEAGFKWPTCVTQSLWADINDIPESKHFQDVAGRLWDVLCMAALKMRGAPDDVDVLPYKLIMHVSNRKYYKAVVKIAPAWEGDGAEITIDRWNA